MVGSSQVYSSSKSDMSVRISVWNLISSLATSIFLAIPSWTQDASCSTISEVLDDDEEDETDAFSDALAVC